MAARSRASRSRLRRAATGSGWRAGSGPAISKPTSFTQPAWLSDASIAGRKQIASIRDCSNVSSSAGCAANPITATWRPFQRWRRRMPSEKTAMARGAGAWGTVNPTYRRYATVLHFHVDACPPRQPRAKGKVERRVRDQRFALDLRPQAWTDLAELQQWTDARLGCTMGCLRPPYAGDR